MNAAADDEAGIPAPVAVTWEICLAMNAQVDVGRTVGRFPGQWMSGEL